MPAPIGTVAPSYKNSIKSGWLGKKYFNYFDKNLKKGLKNIDKVSATADESSKATLSDVKTKLIALRATLTKINMAKKKSDLINTNGFMTLANEFSTIVSKLLVVAKGKKNKKFATLADAKTSFDAAYEKIEKMTADLPTTA